MQHMSPSDCFIRLSTIEDRSIHLVLINAERVLHDQGQGIAMGIFRECHRVLRPGGFLLGFSGPAGFHRAAGSIEDCVAVGEFEMRDAITWSHPKMESSTDYGITDVSTIIAMAQKKKIGTFVDNWIKFGVGLIDTSQTWEGRFPGNVAESPSGDPGEFVRHLIRVFTKPGDRILDPYPLSPNFCVAATSEGRQRVG